MDDLIEKRGLPGCDREEEERRASAAAGGEEAYRLACRRYARLSGRRR